MGECFAHQVNGVDVFAMGADYIPEDNLLGRVNPETTRKLLEKQNLQITTRSGYGAAVTIPPTGSMISVMSWV